MRTLLVILMLAAGASAADGPHILRAKSGYFAR